MTLQQYHSQATNMACHNYCIINPMPVRTRSLLDLGLKYCMKKPRPTNRFDKTVDSFRNDARQIAYFHENPREETEETTYIKELYLKSNREASKAREEVRQCITNFERELYPHQARHKQPTLSNLTPSQWKLTEELNNNDNHIIIEAEKILEAVSLTGLFIIPEDSRSI